MDKHPLGFRQRAKTLDKTLQTKSTTFSQKTATQSLINNSGTKQFEPNIKIEIFANAMEKQFKTFLSQTQFNNTIQEIVAQHSKHPYLKTLLFLQSKSGTQEHNQTAI